MKKHLLSIFIALLFSVLVALPALAQNGDLTVEPTAAATSEPVATAPVAITPTIQYVYIDVLPEWVLPAFAILFAVIAFLIFVIWRQGGKLAEMLSEKAVQGLIKIGLDFARDLANKTATPLDNALLNVVAGEVQPPVTNNITVNPAPTEAG